MNIFNINTDSFSAKQLIQFAETRAVTENILKEYFIVSLFEDENILSKICEETGKAGDSLKSFALKDIHDLLQKMSEIEFNGYVSTIKREIFFKEYQNSLESVVAQKSPEDVLDGLIAHYSAFGAGKNAQYTAFKWENGLNGIEKPDNQSLDRLFCLESQKQTLIENTVLFLKGSPANNALLYGESGSGKSSMVKALLNAYYKDGLRLIEVPKSDLADLPQIIKSVRNKRFKYVIFIDDLSFEQGDTGYKDLKVILDGQIETIPNNILFYATSNRCHMINENWSERQGGEVHVRDSMNEKLSLSERFGLKIGFFGISQKDYFKIIEGILAVPLTEEIKNAAAKWELERGGRSGRAAKQFAMTKREANEL